MTSSQTFTSTVAANGNTVARMGGQYLIGISAAIREETSLKGGNPIAVTLTLATTPRDLWRQDRGDAPAPDPQGNLAPA